ncbi:MgtC/SapB family protein [Pigmentiphaga litoralis]|uniref:Protein MgtC n=1 Tax=Pigmentiphaga litoralis TaxID=516702 RepID=A0A7Y9LMJ0_9BURK|nr:MgtC/SapB family protein [Pigmentiphaga litoralis]NYE22713.1 putative Mg2+ transporter-C (MgtC) family protein [Pigmentiphaga litoralis]NYE83672.1 putative Mg2+ transporter-C (MgtC) family protein [Pigmentiphaga litoralis]
MWNEIWNTTVAEFSDLHDVAEMTRVCVRLLVAMVLGGLLGYERELRGTAAGLRTHMLVAVGAALFVLVPLQAGTQLADMSRVLQGVIAGIGFLGAGAIIKLGEQQVRGVTTAASIWATAAIGIAAGMGREATAILSTVFALVILAAVRKVAPDKRSPPLVEVPNGARPEDRSRLMP